MNHVEGRGLSGVLLLHENYYQFKHFMSDRLLQRAGIDRNKVFEGSFQTPDLDRFCKEKGVRVIVPLGESALGATIGEYDIRRWRGRAIDRGDGIWVVPTFQPSKLLPHRSDDEDENGKLRHPPRFQGVWGRDLHFALDIAKNGYVRREGEYIGDPSEGVIRSFMEEYEGTLNRNPNTYLSWDIETPYKLKQNDEEEMESGDFDGTILRCSFSFKPFHALTVAWAHPYLPAIRRLLANPANRGVGWNVTTFDKPLVESVGFTVAGTTFDGMDAFHLIQSDLDKGLEFVSSLYTDLLPWKHLNNADPIKYSCIDADAALRNFLGIEADMKKANQWETYMNHSVRLMPLLREAGQRGNAVDIVFQNELKVELEAEKARLIEAAQGMVPEELKPRKRYKTTAWPKDIALIPYDYSKGLANGLPMRALWDDRVFDQVMVPNEVNVCTQCGAIDVTKGEHTGKKVVSKTLRGEVHHKKCSWVRHVEEQCIPFGTELAGALPECSCPKGWPKKTWDIVENPCYKVELRKETHPTLEWDEILPFNPNSTDQIRSYIKHFNHPMGTDKKDSTKETADKKHLKQLKKDYGEKHPIYGVGIEMSAVTKTLGTYTPTPSPEGRIHTEYVNSPSTWRLGSRKTAQHGTNMQNWGKREENLWAKRARQQIIATPGQIEIDGELPSWAVERRAA